MKSQFLWIKKGHDNGECKNDLFVFVNSNTETFFNSVAILNSIDFPDLPKLKNMKFAETKKIKITVLED